MSIKLIVNSDDEAILIQAFGSISAKELKQMRKKTIEILNKNGIQNFVVDLSKLTSILEQSTFATYKSGKEFKDINFPLSAKTAVILPVEESVRQQIKFLHVVEINRMRGPIEYVSSYKEALEWFNS